MILKADKIAQLLKDGAKPSNKDPLVITPKPPDLKKLSESGAGSIDIRLGTWFMTLRQARMTHLAVDTPGSQTKLTKTHYVPFGSEYYLHPDSFVLSVTLEWIRLPKDIAAYVIGKSSWGRRGLIIATATGVHPGFKGCLTLELKNVGELPIAIKPGMEICQLFFHHVDTTTDAVDQSLFIGLRRPALGKVELDPIAKKLAEAYASSLPLAAAGAAGGP
jgi:dCTP deaminase